MLIALRKHATCSPAFTCVNSLYDAPCICESAQCCAENCALTLCCVGCHQIAEVISHIEEGNLLPPLVVLQTLAKNPQLKVGVARLLGQHSVAYSFD
jgi:hypothetical protein